MKRHTVFMDWKTQHNKGINCPQNNKFNTIPRKIPARFFVDKDKLPQTYMEKQKNQNS